MQIIKLQITDIWFLKHLFFKFLNQFRMDRKWLYPFQWLKNIKCDFRWIFLSNSSEGGPVSYGILNPMVNWTRGRFTMGFKIPYDTGIYI